MAKPKRNGPSRKDLLNAGDEVSANLGLTIQVGERNFVKVDAGAKTTIRKGEHPDAALDRAFEICELTVNNKVDDYIKEFST